MLARAGVVIDIHTNEWATFYGDLRNGNFDLASSQWVGIGDPHQYYEIFDSHMTPAAGGSNRGYYRIPIWIDWSRPAMPPRARRPPRASYAQVQQARADDLPYVSLWWDDNVAAMDRGLERIRTLSQRQPDFARNGGVSSMLRSGAPSDTMTRRLFEPPRCPTAGGAGRAHLNLCPDSSGSRRSRFRDAR